MNDIASSAVICSGPGTTDDDDDVIMTQEEIGVKCPYTQQVMKYPVRNIICGHNYERTAIQEFIMRKKGNAKLVAHSESFSVQDLSLFSVTYLPYIYWLSLSYWH